MKELSEDNDDNENHTCANVEKCPGWFGEPRAVGKATISWFWDESVFQSWVIGDVSGFLWDHVEEEVQKSSSSSWLLK